MNSFNTLHMKKVIFTVSILFLAFLSMGQTKYGFASKGYDNFNVNDDSASVEVVFFTPNDDTLLVATGSTISPIDGSARNGFEYNFAAQAWTFPIGSTLYNGTNRKRINFNFVKNSTIWGTRYFYMRLTSLIGITASDLLYGQDQLLIIIDYDGTKVGINKLSVHDYRLFPIPATRQLFIEGVNTNQFKIYDLTGRLVKEGDVLQNTIDVSDLSNGLYVLNGLSDKGMIVQKFLKQ